MGAYQVASTEFQEIADSVKNPKAFEPIYNRHFQSIYTYMRNSVRDPELAADLCADVFYSALLNIRKFKITPGGIRPWLFKIAVNILRMHFRKNKSVLFIPLADYQIQELISVETSIEIADLRKYLAGELSKLNSDEQELIQLRFVAECSYREIGIIYEISEAAAKMRISRIIDKLKKIIPQNLKS
ncbi:MAG: sigma-70 family RNA polymerase sigma factor [Bacteroidia bacterium]